MAEPEEPLDPATRLRLHLEALRARMDPGRFEAFARLAAGTAQAMDEAAARHSESVVDLPDTDEQQLDPDLVGELLTVIAILNGKDEHTEVVRVGQGWALIEKDAAADPEKLAEARAWIERRIEESARDDEELRGIARASGLDERPPATPEA